METKRYLYYVISLYLLSNGGYLWCPKNHFKIYHRMSISSGTSILTLDQYSASTTGVTNTQTYSNSVENECTKICKESKFVKKDNLCKETTLQVNNLNSKHNNSKLLEKLDDFHLNH